MHMAGKHGLETSAKGLAMDTRTKRQANLNMQPFHPARLAFGEALLHPGKQRSGRLVGRVQEMLQSILNIAGCQARPCRHAYGERCATSQRFSPIGSPKSEPEFSTIQEIRNRKGKCPAKIPDGIATIEVLGFG
jgi:hypothetical protein